MNPRVFLDFTADGEPLGRVICELFADSVPKTAENFRALCTGEKGISPKSQLPLYFKNSIIHRSIQDFMIQGGDFTKRNGMGGESIYGGPFEDEDLVREVDSEALLVMANRGPNTNSSQFFITLRPCPHLNGKHVVFGRIVRGYDDVVLKIATVATDEKDRPVRPVVIVNCGELERRKVPAKREPSPLTVSESDDENRGRSHKRKKHRRHASSSRTASNSRSYSRSRSRSRSNNEDERKNKRKHKHKSKRKSKLKNKDHEGTGQPTEPRKETEEEYDARLEREEKERLEAERQAEISRLRENLRREEGERKSQDSGRINYKGRGRMKYVDPETTNRRYDRRF